MTLQLINIGSTSSPSGGDSLQIFATKSNSNFIELYNHVADLNNPHQTTATQVNAIPNSELAQANGVATLGSDGLLTVSQRWTNGGSTLWSPGVPALSSFSAFSSSVSEAVILNIVTGSESSLQNKLLAQPVGNGPVGNGSSVTMINCYENPSKLISMVCTGEYNPREFAGITIPIQNSSTFDIAIAINILGGRTTYNTNLSYEYNFALGWTDGNNNFEYFGKDNLIGEGHAWIEYTSGSYSVANVDLNSYANMFPAEGVPRWFIFSYDGSTMTVSLSLDGTHGSPVYQQTPLVPPTSMAFVMGDVFLQGEGNSVNYTATSGWTADIYVIDFAAGTRLPVPLGY